ncbi:aquaporin family protein [Rhodobacteraceae bacterium KMS-5]|uniref:Aquaporin family protein n=2 Tax=Tabrizicola oligotrophica TaxID=2710650 RepID=A0A6M0QQZ7_9RHOB|nr:aquaporin family protein [Tabrizicola oligotrophica]
MGAGMLRKLVAEALGTAGLMAAVTGSTLMGERLAAGAATGLLVSSLVTGGALVVLLTLLIPVSGGHLNPAVTLMAGLRREIAVPAALAYGAAQVLGAVAGVATAHLMFDLPAFTLSTLPRDLPSLWLSEAIATAGLIFVILGGSAARGPVPALVGAYIAAAFWFTASTGFANPAMTIARTLTDSAAGLRPQDLPAYLLAQVAGALAGYALGHWLFGKEKPPGLADGG